MVWGKPKSGKTFWVLDLCVRIAAGIPYRGREVTQGTVIYCTFEGAWLFPPRARAAAIALGVESADVPFFYVPDRSILKKVGGADQLIESIKQAGVVPSLVVFDTVNRSLEGSESSDEDMSHYIRCIEDVNQAFTCASILVHHCGVAGDRPRGHTSLTGTCAAQICIERASKATQAGQPMLICARVEFMKDGPEGGEEFSWLEPVEVPFPDGSRDDSCRVTEAPRPAGRDPTDMTAPSRVKKALSVLQEAIDQTDDKRVTLAEWRRGYELVSRGKKAAVTRAFYRALDALKEQGTISIDGKWVFLGNKTS